jgi:hypothetical protein
VLIITFDPEREGWWKIENEALHNLYHILLSIYQSDDQNEEDETCIENFRQ